MQPVKLTKLLRFLRRDLEVPSQSLRLALRQSETEESTQLPMVLWHYGLISLQQLNQIFDWIDQERCPICKP